MKKIYVLLSLMLLSMSVFSQGQKRGLLTNVLVKGVECDIKFDISKKGVLEIEI